MTNSELVSNALVGANLSDYTESIDNHYRQQSKSIKGNQKSDNIDTSKLESKMDEVKLAIIKKPVVKDDLIKVSKTAIEISRQVTINRMTRTEKLKTRL
jgi:hypothetical protein